jgi:hypothetical protein
VDKQPAASQHAHTKWTEGKGISNKENISKEWVCTVFFAERIEGCFDIWVLSPARTVVIPLSILHLARSPRVPHLHRHRYLDP